jgi:Ras association (RalGDS/AF-6) domain
MRHRDPRLFFLSMEVRIRRAGARTMLMLDDSARPAMLQACHPSGESKFHLQMKTGGLIRVHTSALQQTSQYKSLLISEQTTSDELLGLLLSCYSLSEPVEEFSLYEVCPDQEYQRKLHPDDMPLRAQIQRNQKGENCHFLVRRIRNLSRRALKLDNETESCPKANYSVTLTAVDAQPLHSTDAAAATEISKSASSCASSTAVTAASPASIAAFKSKFSKLESCLCKLTLRIGDSDMDENGNVKSPQKCPCNLSPPAIRHCNHCSRKALANPLRGFGEVQKSVNDKPVTSSTYSPVYNVREIRSMGNSFSSLGADKNFMELEALSSSSSATAISRRHSVAVDEVVNTHPSMGIGNYIYI